MGGVFLVGGDFVCWIVSITLRMARDIGDQEYMDNRRPMPRGRPKIFWSEGEMVDIPGWCFKAALRYAVLISSSVAVFEMSRTSYGSIAGGSSSRSSSPSWGAILLIMLLTLGRCGDAVRPWRRVA